MDILSGSSLHQTVLGRSRSGGAVPRRARGVVPFKEVCPPSIVGASEVLAAELKEVDSFDTFLSNEIPEKENDGEGYVRVKKVKRVDIGARSKYWKRTEQLSCGSRLSLSQNLHQCSSPTVHPDIGVSNPEPEPVLWLFKQNRNLSLPNRR